MGHLEILLGILSFYGCRLVWLNYSDFRRSFKGCPDDVLGESQTYGKRVSWKDRQFTEKGYENSWGKGFTVRRTLTQIDRHVNRRTGVGHKVDTRGTLSRYRIGWEVRVLFTSCNFFYLGYLYPVCLQVSSPLTHPRLGVPLYEFGNIHRLKCSTVPPLWKET